MAATSSKPPFSSRVCLCARQYFDRDDARERELRDRINALWREAEWDWHTQGGRQLLYWHWSPNNGWSINHEIRGWNECLITYVLAASSPHHAIDDEVYHRGWAQGRTFINGRDFYGTILPLGPDFGGPLFFAQFASSGSTLVVCGTAMPTTGSRTSRMC